MILGMVYRWVWNMINFSRREHGCWEAVCTNSDAARPSYPIWQTVLDASLWSRGRLEPRDLDRLELRNLDRSEPSWNHQHHHHHHHHHYHHHHRQHHHKHQYPREQMSCFLACTAESGFRVYNRGTYLTWNMFIYIYIHMYIYVYIYIYIYVHTYKNKDALENTCFVFPDFWTFQEKHSKSM